MFWVAVGGLFSSHEFCMGTFGDGGKVFYDGAGRKDWHESVFHAVQPGAHAVWETGRTPWLEAASACLESGWQAAGDLWENTRIGGA